MLSVVIPSYNERNGIALIITLIHQAIKNIEHEIIVVDDSNDGTNHLLAQIVQSDPLLRFHHREGQRGLASAVVLGFSMATGDVLCMMDADLQHPPELLPVMYKAILTDADIVIPSRFLPGSRTSHLSLWRRAGSVCGKRLSKVLLHSLWRISDPLGGFMMFKRAVIEDVPLRPVGWRVQMEVLAMGHYRRIVEIPYAFQRRYADRSKLNLRPLMEDIWHMLQLMARSERERRYHLFVLIAGLCVLFDMLVFYPLHTGFGFGSGPNVSATLSAVSAIIPGHLLNHYALGRRKQKNGAVSIKTVPLRFCLVYGLGIGVKNLILSIMMMIGWSAMAANLAGIAIAGLLSYGLCVHLGIGGTEQPKIMRRTLQNGGNGP